MTPEEQAAADAAAVTKELGWRANLPTDLQKDETLVRFKDETEMIQMPINVAKSYVHARSLVGADVIKMPQTDEEWSNIYTKLGKPETQELYVLPNPEGMNPALNDTMGKDAGWFREVAHKIGLNDKQATTLFQEYAKRTSDGYTQISEQAGKEALNTEIQLRTEFGSTYDGKNVLGDRALEKLGGDSLINFVNQMGLEKHPEFKRLKFALGTMLAEDLGLDKTTGELITSKESIQEQIANLQGNKAYLDPKHAEHKAVVEKVTRLMQQLHGVKPIPVTVAGTVPAI